MIYPTRFAVLLMAAGAPLAALAGVARPGLWSIGLIWIGAAAMLLLLDALFCASGRRLKVELTAPGGLYVGRAGEVRVDAGFDGRLSPRTIDIALGTNEKLGLDADRGRVRLNDGGAALVFTAQPLRRGLGQVTDIWLRWRGPFGLVWRQMRSRPGRNIPIIPNIAAVREEAVRLFSRQGAFGMKIQREAGEGAEFHALKDFQPGMDIRSVDWKQSARHARLLAKEHRTERNHHLIFAIDCGRTMSEPLAGQPRLDRALNAALLLSFVSLKLGDRVGLFGFDSKVRVASGVVSGVRGFSLIQHLASGLDYSTEETNFTLGLSTLAAELERRSLIIIFTDFPDSISAELMIENTERLMQRHRVLFIAMQDIDLEVLARAEPKTPEDVSRAVTAAALLKERELVLHRLRRLGIEVLEAPLDQISTRLVSAYLEIKQRNVL
jgi:uncharacterized protein (DUF58 family)